MTACLEVNGAHVYLYSTRKASDWWTTWTMYQRSRVTVLNTSPAGDLVEVACEDREHAEWLRDFMAEQGIPRRALKVRRRKPTGAPIWIECEGTDAIPLGPGICPMCGRTPGRDNDGRLVAHQRDDLLARIERGDFGRPMRAWRGSDE